MQIRNVMPRSHTVSPRFPFLVHGFRFSVDAWAFEIDHDAGAPQLETKKNPCWAAFVHPRSRTLVGHERSGCRGPTLFSLHAPRPSPPSSSPFLVERQFSLDRRGLSITDQLSFSPPNPPDSYAPSLAFWRRFSLVFVIFSGLPVSISISTSSPPLLPIANSSF